MLRLKTVSVRMQRLGKQLVVTGGAVLLSACDTQDPRPGVEPDRALKHNDGTVSVSQANAYIAEPNSEEQARLNRQIEPGEHPVPDYAVDFIGRYQGLVTCDGAFIPCKQGKAEYILNLLPDGTLHRSIIQYGKVFTETAAEELHNATYRKDTWTVNPERTQLVIHRKEGMNFYYSIKDNAHLVADLNKVHSPDERINQQLFKQGFPKPKHSFELEKVMPESQ